MFLSIIKLSLYKSYVKFNPYVCAHYEGYKDSNPQFHAEHKIKSWRFLYQLRKYYKRGAEGKFPDAPLPYRVKTSIFNELLKDETLVLKKEKAPQGNLQNDAAVIIPESNKHIRPTPVQLSRQLLDYDVISFDVFDTLIFRPFREPFDLFDIVGAELNIANFKTLRRKAENVARDETWKRNRQVDIFDIYNILARYVDIDVDAAINKELEVEERLCFANPYMKQVFSILQQNNKEIIALSDMYLPENLLGGLLRHCGYAGFSKIIVSCDLQAGKADGELQKKARLLVGAGKSFVHIGDNFPSDVQASRKMGWTAIHYANINSIRNQVCPPFSNHLDTSVYHGIIASYIHNGLMKKNKYYQHGFIYGGIMAEGYCEFLEDLAAEKKIDKLLFVSRDGNIIWKVYKEFFNHVEAEYIMWSRLAAYTTTFDKFTEDIVQHCILGRVNKTAAVSIEVALNETGLACIKTILIKKGFDLKEKLTEKNAALIIDILYESRDFIRTEFHKYRQAARLYFESIVQGCKKICIVDLGWRGTTLIQLKSLLNEWFPDIEIILSFAGLSTVGSSFCTSNYLRKDIYAYMFSDELNKDLFSKHFDSKMPLNNAMTEITFGVPQSSFVKFDFVSDEGYDLTFSDAEIPNFSMSRDIQKGIWDFIKVFHKSLGEYKKYIRISPYTAYLPLYHVLSDMKYLKDLFSCYEMNLETGTFSEERRMVIGDYMKLWNL